MANRVILGNKSGQYGIFVSKPGVDVTTASEDGLHMSTAVKNLQVVQNGSFSGTNGSATNISWSALGFRPVLIVSSQMAISYTYTSDNSAAITPRNPPVVWNLSGYPGISNTVYWFVVSEPY